MGNVCHALHFTREEFQVCLNVYSGLGCFSPFLCYYWQSCWRLWCNGQTADLTKVTHQPWRFSSDLQSWAVINSTHKERQSLIGHWDLICNSTSGLTSTAGAPHCHYTSGPTSTAGGATVTTIQHYATQIHHYAHPKTRQETTQLQLLQYYKAIFR